MSANDAEMTTSAPPTSERVEVSVIMPMKDVPREILVEALDSIAKQTFEGSMEISIRDDGSQDGSLLEFVEDYLRTKWERSLGRRRTWVASRSSAARGAGNARNEAIAQSHGVYLCLHDADDVSHPDRVRLQYGAMRRLSRVYGESEMILLGTKFERIPEGSTSHYTAFLNSLDDEGIRLKQFREITMIQPTWFLSRRAFDRVGRYVEGTLAEDLEWFHQFLDFPNAVMHSVDVVEDDESDRDAKRAKREKETSTSSSSSVSSGEKTIPLLRYRYNAASASNRTPRRLLEEMKTRAFERRVLRGQWLTSPEATFTIWGCGRDGRAFYNHLAPEFRAKVSRFCDIDPRKIESGYTDGRGKKVPVVHFSQAEPPVVICVAMGRTGGELENNIASRGWVEGRDYWHFT